MKLRDEDLTRELRAMRPEIDPDFAAELDAWAAEGFPSAKQIERRDGGEADRPSPLRERFRRFRERPLLPAVITATTVVFAFAIAVGVYQSQREDGVELFSGASDDAGIAEVSGEGPDRQTQSAPPAGSGGSASAEQDGLGRSEASIEPAPTTVPPVQGREPLRPGEDRVQERNASMTLSTEPDQVAEVADGVVEVTERYDGIVVSSDVNTSSERGRASFDLRIPTQSLQAALADLSDLASVAERNEGTLDITAPFVSAEERFADAKAEVDALVEQLGEADSADEIASIREQLQVARPELAAARSELAALKQRAGFSTLAISVVGDGDADGWSLGDAVDDAVSVLEDLGGATIVALAVIVPLGILASALWFGLGAARRRARERTLDE